MYKVENGKVFEVKEVSTVELQKKVKQVVAYVKQCDEKEKPYLNAIATKRNELTNVTTRLTKEIDQLQVVVDDQEKRKADAKAELVEMKDVIAQLFPEDSNFLAL